MNSINNKYTDINEYKKEITLLNNNELINKIIEKHKNKINEYNNELNDINEYLSIVNNELNDIRNSIYTNKNEILKLISNIINIFKKLIDLKFIDSLIISYLNNKINQYNKIQSYFDDNLFFYEDDECFKLNFIFENIDILIEELKKLKDNSDKKYNLIINELNEIYKLTSEIRSIIESTVFKKDEYDIKSKYLQENKRLQIVIESIELNKESLLYWEEKYKENLKDE